MGLFDDLYPPIADRSSLVDGTAGVEIFKALAPASGEHVIKKHRYSGFYGTDLEIILRQWGITTVIVSGTTTENCCHATARDAMFRDFKVIFLSDATGTFDYPDVGQGAMSAEEVHKATLTICGILYRRRDDRRRIQGARSNWQASHGDQSGVARYSAPTPPGTGDLVAAGFGTICPGSSQECWGRRAASRHRRF